MHPLADKKPDGSPYPITKSAQQWREELTDFEFQVLREAGTEPAWSGTLPSDGELIYRCRGCNTELFSTKEKFDSRCGWPSFFSPLAGENIIELEDRSLGTVRTEVRCAACGSHLGHVFSGEGFDTPTDLRYCINAVCLTADGES
jgi:peptide-methionine (R)-S-oxide reductase